MDTETLKALTRIGEIEAREKELKIELDALEFELVTLHGAVRAAGWTRTRSRKTKAEPAKKRGAKEVAP